MKRYPFYTSVLALAALLFVSSCSKNDESAIDKATRQLTAGAWNLSSVTVDGTSHSDLFQGMTLRFTGNTYTTTHGGPVWPASDTWNFENGSPGSIRRGDGVDVQVTSLTDTSLTLRLTWDQTILSAGRSNALAGDHVFQFTKTP
jgi:hypothetical protein